MGGWTLVHEIFELNIDVAQRHNIANTILPIDGADQEALDRKIPAKSDPSQVVGAPNLGDFPMQPSTHKCPAIPIS